MARNAVCDGMLGIVSLLVVCPADHVKTRMQTVSATTAAVGLSPPLSLCVAGNILGSHGAAGLY